MACGLLFTCPSCSIVSRGVAGQSLPVHAVVTEVDDTVDGVHSKMSVVSCICAGHCLVPGTRRSCQTSSYFSLGCVHGVNLCWDIALLCAAIELHTKHGDKEMLT